MKIRVLGSAAGGGFPQWNCNCPNCKGVRAGRPGLSRRTQSSIAVSADGQRWTLVNASPDLLQQLQDFPGSWPAGGLRGCGIESVVLVDAQIDHTTGLYMLREKGSPWPIWTTDPVYEDLTRGNPILHLLEHYCGVARQPIPLDGRPFHPEGTATLAWHAMPLRSAAPPYSPHRNAPVAGDNVGLTIEDPTTGGRVFYAPGLAEIDVARGHGADHVAAAAELDPFHRVAGLLLQLTALHQHADRRTPSRTHARDGNNRRNLFESCSSVYEKPAFRHTAAESRCGKEPLDTLV